MDPHDPFAFSTTSSESSKHKRSHKSVSNTVHSSGLRKQEADPDYNESGSTKKQHRRNKSSKGNWAYCLINIFCSNKRELHVFKIRHNLKI